MFKRKLLSMVLVVGMLFGQSVPRALAATICDQAQFVSDLSIPDGTALAPGAAFTKTWRLKNVGTCTWTTTYKAVWAGGDQMGAAASVRLPASVAPGQMVDISVNMTSPNASAHYKGLWKLSNATGIQFGVGDSGSDAFWVDINVIENKSVIYDFVANAQYAQWKSGAGPLPFPILAGDERGFAYPVNNPHLEDDSIDSAPGLLTVPQNKYNGYIQATFPEIQIQAGDQIQTLVNCEFGARGCYVTFRIDYLTATGIQRTLWSWQEAYEGRFYRATINLNSLAGQKVRFVFMLLSTGLASSDRAIWGAPRIVRTGSTLPPAPPPTLTPLPPLTPTPTAYASPPPTIAPAGCDKATFVADVTFPDGTLFSPGATFIKTWRLKNSGTCTWTNAYKLVFYTGEQMGAPTSINVPWNVLPNQTADLTVNLVAPGTAGTYRGYWILSNANGILFGIGTDASRPIWVEVNVSGVSSGNSGYDFVANACAAQWRSGAGILPCPGTDNDSHGFVFTQDSTQMEDGSAGTSALITFPENKYNGYIQGYYPVFTVQPGDRFQTTIGCAFGSACYVTYRLDYKSATGLVTTFWTWRERNEGKTSNISVDLGPLAGRSVSFILTILATGYATGDRTIWASPRIARTGVALPTITPIPPTNGWPTLTNATFGFAFKYPPQSQVFNQFPESLLMNLPITPGTNLSEKYLDQRVLQNIATCAHPTVGVSPNRVSVVINGLNFFKDTGEEGAVGQFRKWTAYSTTRNNLCVTSLFVLHSTNPDNYDPPIPVFDEAAESAVFLQMMSTFAWTTAIPTPTSTATSTPINTSTNTPVAMPGTIVPAPVIRSLSMLDAFNGWALGDSQLLRTSDGGVTWYNVLSVPINGSFFQSASKSWILSGSVLYRTTDGGHTWTQNNVPFSGGALQFINDANGFVLNGEPVGMMKHPIYVYQTSNGGTTWTLKYTDDPLAANSNASIPFSGFKRFMTFRDTLRGWIGGNTPMDGFVYLYKTTDGGTTWAQQNLTLPSGYSSAFIDIGAPQFFNANDAIMPVWMTLGIDQRDLFLYVSHDGGNTWAASTGFSRQGTNPDFISMNDAITWNWNGYFHVTHNSGASWSQITPNLSFGDTVPNIDFISTTTGWMFLNDINVIGPSLLYRTSDGGATWTLLHGNAPIPTQTSTPPPSATSTPLPIPQDFPSFGQSLVNALNTRNFDTVKIMMDQTFVFGFWQSQGISETADIAIESLRANHLGATPLTADPGKDLNSLLGGLNPYAIMGLDPTKSQGLFVSGWGLDGKGEAILYATRRADGSAYWHSVLIAPSGFIPSPTPTAQANFCADSRIATLIEQLKGSMNQSNGDMFAALVSPTHGVDVRLWAYSSPVNFNSTSAKNVFTSTDSYTWGGGPSGIPDVGTFKNIIQPKLADVLNAPNMETYCDNLTKVFPLANPWPYSGMHYYNLYKPASSAGFDFRTWLIGFEYVNGQPYISALVTIVWEP